MFSSRNKKTNVQLRTIIWRPVSSFGIISLFNTINPNNRLVPLVDKALLPLRILRLVTSIYLQVENPTHATAHAPEKIFQHKLQIFSVALV